MLLKLTLVQGVEPATSRQELATESMEDPGRQIERHARRSREGLRDLRAFLVWDRWRDTCLLGFLARKVSWLLLRCSDLADLHFSI